MKTKFLITVLSLATFISVVSSKNANQNSSKRISIEICSSPELETLAKAFVSQYQTINPAIDFNLVTGTSNALQSATAPRKIGLITEDRLRQSDVKSASVFVIGRQVVVPVINKDNSNLTVLALHGVKPEKLKEVLCSKLPVSWKTLAGDKADNTEARIFIQNNKLTLNAVSSFLNITPEQFPETKILGQEELTRRVQTDKLAIGFISLDQVIDQTKNTLSDNLSFLPIDRNGNGVIDTNEKIYANLNEFKRGVWIGKFPQLLVQNVYAITTPDINNTEVENFLTWVITDGQKWLQPSGFTELVINERQAKIDKIKPFEIPDNNSDTANKPFNVFFLTIITIAVLTVGFFVLLKIINNTRQNSTGKTTRKELLTEETLAFPKGLLYDKSHTWIYMKKAGILKFGIDDFIPKVTGEFTKIIMKNPGDRILRNEPVVTLIQNGKQIVINSPVSGIVKEINEDLVTDPQYISNSPYEKGWIYEIEPGKWKREFEFLKFGEDYMNWIKREIDRLKDFLSCSHGLNLIANPQIVYQEGGELYAYPLKDEEPRIWEDFQTYFINTADIY